MKRHIYVLSESVAARRNESGLGKADTVHLWVRDKELKNYSFQKKIRPTALCGEIAEEAYRLFRAQYTARRAVRGLGVTVSGFDKGVRQLSFDDVTGDYAKKERAEQAVDKIRRKYGYSKIQRGIMYEDKSTLFMDVRGERLVRPGGVDGEVASQDEGLTDTEPFED